MHFNEKLFMCDSCNFLVRVYHYLPPAVLVLLTTRRTTARGAPARPGAAEWSWTRAPASTGRRGSCSPSASPPSTSSTGSATHRWSYQEKAAKVFEFTLFFIFLALSPLLPPSLRYDHYIGRHQHLSCDRERSPSPGTTTSWSGSEQEMRAGGGALNSFISTPTNYI